MLRLAELVNEKVEGDPSVLPPDADQTCTFNGRGPFHLEVPTQKALEGCSHRWFHVSLSKRVKACGRAWKLW